MHCLRLALLWPAVEDRRRLNNESKNLRFLLCIAFAFHYLWLSPKIQPNNTILMSKKQDTDSIEQPRMVTSHDIHIDAQYAEWIAEVKHRYRSAQVKAAVKVNAEKLLFNWQLGRDLVQKKAEERWGAGVVEQVS